MRLISLQSGSNGNCLYVEADDCRLLFDAGLSGVQVQQRLAQHGVDVRQVQAVLISHDHRDHSCAMGIYQRKFGLPVHVTPRTLHAARQRCEIGPLEDVRYFRAGETLRFGRVAVETVLTPHDAADGVGFIIDDGRRRLGILTDLGHVFTGLDAAIASLDAVLLESNYDPDMLAAGNYPEFLQRRIRGPMGHLSNIEAAELLLAAANDLQWACLGHLSHDNNSPKLALATHRQVLGRRWPLYVATRYECSGAMEVV
jgi:phosphoribosyl 1,2-cyclic phosphodiesterase